LEDSIDRKLSKKEIKLLDTLQRVHDEEDVMDWHDILSEIAEKYGFEMLIL
jgi:hypothetical protein